MKVVIIGSTGLTGNLLLDKLLANEKITKVISISRQSTGKKSPKLEEVLISNFNNLKKDCSLIDGEIFFCCLGTTIKKAKNKENFKKIDYEAVIDFALIAQNNHARLFSVISANGVKKDTSIFYYQVKYEMEEKLKSMNFATLQIFHPALLYGDRKEFRAGERFAEILLSPLKLFPSSLRKKLLTSSDDLAEAMLNRALYHSEESLVIAPSQI